MIMYKLARNNNKAYHFKNNELKILIDLIQIHLLNEIKRG